MNVMTSSEKIEKLFEKYFQKTVELSVGGEIFKKGKFLLIENKILHNNYYFEFLLEKTKKIDIMKLPFPFNVEEHYDDGIVYFDYRLKTFLNNSSIEYNKKIKSIIDNNKIIPSKLFDNILEIKFE